MTIVEQTPTVSYTGDGVATVFSFAFQILANADLIVEINEVTQVENTDYTIENLSVSGGDVDFGISTAPAVDDAILIFRNTPDDQDVLYTPFDPFPAKTHEGALDELTLIVQELRQNTAVDLSDVLSLDPSKVFWDAETKRIKNLVQPQDPNDAATKQYTDDAAGSGFDPTTDRLITGEWTFSVEIIGTASGNTANAQDETITGNWGFTEKVQLAGGAILGHSVALTGLNLAGDTEVFIAVVGTDDMVFFGDGFQKTQLFGTEIDFFAGGVFALRLDAAGNTILPNDRKLQGRNAADSANLDIATVDNADLIIIGSAGNNLRLQTFASYDLRIAGVSVMGVDSSRFNPLIDILLIQNKSILGRNQANDDDLNLIGIVNDFVNIGDPDAGVIIDSSSLGISLNHESVEIADTVTLANGGLRVVDRNSQKRKAGFRDATTRFVTGIVPLLQTDEDSFVQCDSVTTEITVPQLEQDTQITIVNRQNTAVDLTAEGSLTGGIEFFDGQGSFPTGDRIIPGGGVCHVRYRDSVSVSIWGNGIT